MFFVLIFIVLAVILFITLTYARQWNGLLVWLASQSGILY